jgi:hypothetical protein
MELTNTTSYFPAAGSKFRMLPAIQLPSAAWISTASPIAKG